MKFMFDLDETLIQGDLISITCAELLRKGLIDRLYTNRDVKYYDLRDLPELLRSRVIDRFSDPDYVWFKHPIPGTFCFLWTLENLGHKTGVVTARPKPIQGETTRFIRARFPEVEFDLGINFVNTAESMEDEMPSKMQFLRQTVPNFYFDDNVDYCVESKELGLDTYLISNKHTPWNHKFAEKQRKEVDPVKILRNVSFFPETIIHTRRQ